MKKSETQIAREACAILYGGSLADMYRALCPGPLALLAAQSSGIEHYALDALDAAIQRDADLRMIWPQWARWLFGDFLREHDICADIAGLFGSLCEGREVSSDEWQAAKNAAQKIEEATGLPRTPPETKRAAYAVGSAVLLHTTWGVNFVFESAVMSTRDALEGDNQAATRTARRERMSLEIVRLLDGAPKKSENTPEK